MNLVQLSSLCRSSGLAPFEQEGCLFLRARWFPFFYAAADGVRFHRSLGAASVPVADLSDARRCLSAVGVIQSALC